MHYASMHAGGGQLKQTCTMKFTCLLHYVYRSLVHGALECMHVAATIVKVHRSNYTELNHTHACMIIIQIMPVHSITFMETT